MKNLLVIWLLFFCTIIGLTQERNWFSLPEELSGGSVHKIIAFQGKLVACGTFTNAGGQSVNGIAAWNGSTWSALGGGLTLNGGMAYPLDMAVYHDSLYVVGNFDTAGNVSTVHVAGWDGNNWFSMGTGTDFFVNSVEVFNDTLYVGGQFDTINGIEAKGIAKWNGTSWQNIGKGTRNIVGDGNAASMHVYQNKLFITGNIDSAGTIACENIAWWDGSMWGTFPSAGFPSFGAPMITWQDTLLFCTGASDVGIDYMNEMHYWDGTTYYWYTWQAMSSCGALAIFEGELYGGGADLNYNYGNTVWKRNGSTWEMAGTGLNDAVTSLCEFNGDLYAGGNFTQGGGSQHNYIARFALMNGIKENNEAQNLQIYPNPFSENVTMQFELDQKENVVIRVLDSQGRLIREMENMSFNAGMQKIDMDLSELEKGIYFVHLVAGNQITRAKIVKQ